MPEVSDLDQEHETGDAVAVADDRADGTRTAQQLQQRVAQLEALYHLSEIAAQAESAEAIYEAALDELQRTLRADHAAVLLFDPDGVIRFKAWRNLSDGYRQAAEGHTPWTPTTPDPRPVLVADVDVEPSLAGLRARIRAEGIQALAFVPLVTQGRLLGKFMIYYDVVHAFAGAEVQFAEAVAGQVAAATERKHAEEERARLAAQVQAERQRLDAIIAAVPGVVWEAWGRPDAATQRIDFVSSYVETMLGYSVDEWLTTPNFWLSIVHPEDKEEAARTAGATFAGEGAGVNRFRWVRKDGSILWVEARSTPIQDAAGQPLGLRGVTMDITDRVLLEEQIRRQAAATQAEYERLATLVDHLDVALVLFDPHGRIQLVNDAWLDLGGYQREEVLGRRYDEVRDHPPASEIQAMIDRVLATGEPALLREYPLARAGQPASGVVDGSFLPIYGPEGTITGLLSVMVDVTDKVHAREEVEAQRALLESILDGTPVGIVFYDHEMRIVNHNAAWADALGLDSTRTRGAVLYEILPESRKSQEVHAQVLAGEAVDQENVRFPESGDGNPRYYDVRHRPIRDATGAVTGMLTSTVDVTTRHELERQKDEFLSIASHELKTPVTTIKGYAQAGLRALRLGGDERIVRTLRIIDEQSDRLTRLINELLDVSRAQSGVLPFYEEPFDLSALVAEVVHDLQLTAPEFTLALDLAPALPVVADRQRVEQVVHNLVQNAIKYSGASRRVEVVVTRSDAQALVSVRDFGVGIPANQQAYIFERFFRASNVHAQHYSGMGLGLFISHGIITRHGGRMWVESTEGVGSTFNFTLPLAADQAAPSALS